MKKTHLFAVITFCVTTVFMFSCDKEDDNYNNGGDGNYLELSDIMQRQGYVNVNLEGTTEDGVELDDSFNAEYYFKSNEQNSSAYYDDDDYYRIYISRCTDINETAFVGIDVYINKSSMTISRYGCDVQYKKALDNSSNLIYSYHNWYLSENMESFSFDPSSGLVAGEFSLFETYSVIGDTVVVGDTVQYTIIPGDTVFINADFEVTVQEFLNK